MTPLERRTWLENFVAWGDPSKAGLAMVAFEEGGTPFSSDEELVDRVGFPLGAISGEALRYGVSMESDRPATNHGRVTEQMQEYLSIRLQDSLCIARRNDFAVTGNLFPLKRLNKEAPWGSTIGFLGFDDDQAVSDYCYSSEMIKKRLCCIKDLYLRMQDRNGVMVFMGVEKHMNDIMEALIQGVWRNLEDMPSLSGHGYEGQRPSCSGRICVSRMISCRNTRRMSARTRVRFDRREDTAPTLNAWT